MNIGYQTLGSLIGILQKHESVQEFLPIVERANSWRELRNKALHEMVKFSPCEHPT
jgi:hypothetical protein